MDDSLKQLLEMASQLDAEARAELIDRLIDADAPSPQDWDANWSAEVNRRLADYHAGREPAYDADEVLAEGRRRAATLRKL